MDVILKYSEMLKSVSEIATIEESGHIIRKLENSLRENKNGIGLSAIQIGIPKRIFIVNIGNTSKNEYDFIHFINPELISCNGDIIFENEGCLSYPGLNFRTKRYENYVLKRGVIEDNVYREETNYFYYNMDGYNDIIAIAVQHEMDHLDGKVIIDYGVKISSNNNVKIGRNEKCPCGSGKKFKHCCINLPCIP